MPAFPLHSASPSEPTQFPELNGLLRDLVGHVTWILDDNLLGVYLQGSFAVGDADIDSDCDFLVVTHHSVTPAHEAALRDLHREIPTRPGHWAHHLEGSYPPKDELRGLDGLGRAWLYIDHGWQEMQWSTHCNSEVVRWSLRERGVTLVGPDPHDLVDEVGAEVLRAKMQDYAVSFLPDLYSWINFEIAWAQRYAVATLSRILYTLDSGQVASKRASMLWAIDHIDPTFGPLIQQAVDDRHLGWVPGEPPRPGTCQGL
jgi:hypothetical protein